MGVTLNSKDIKTRIRFFLRTLTLVFLCSSLFAVGPPRFNHKDWKHDLAFDPAGITD